MRFAFAVLALVACNSSDPPADASRADAACTPGMFLGRCMCGTELTGSVSCLPSGYGTTGCVCPDATTPTDATADAPAEVGPEASTPDTPAPEDRPAPADAGDAGRCPLGVTGMCRGVGVNFTIGYRLADGGTTHCGVCDNQCPSGTACAGCICER